MADRFVIVRVTREERRILQREARRRSTPDKRVTIASIMRAWIARLGKAQRST